MTHGVGAHALVPERGRRTGQANEGMNSLVEQFDVKETGQVIAVNKGFVKIA